jgi:hypothetical protein
MKRIAILQSNYIPWKGFFDIINMVDEFIIYDDAQYTKRDWRNRNQIKTSQGPKWLTIPVEVKNKYKQTIRETKVAGNSWIDKHLKILKHNYSGTKFYSEIGEWIFPLFYQCEKEKFLSDINLIFIRRINTFFGIKTKICYSTDYKLEGDKSEKVMNICLQAGAAEYVTGPAAKSYLDVDAFTRKGIKVIWMDYSGYKEYPQQYPPFIHEVSIVDLLFNSGYDSSKYLNSFS